MPIELCPSGIHWLIGIIVMLLSYFKLMKRNRKKLQIISHCRSAVGHANSGKYFPPCLEASHWGSATIFCLSNPASYAVVDLKDVALTNFLRLVDYSHNSTTRLF
jgi:hypothetical protein